MIYLDNNATTQAAKEVIDVMIEELSQPPSNPSAVHTLGQRAKARLQKARQIIASFLKVKSHEIIFTSGGTESMNLLIQGACKGKKNGHIITSAIEHSCVEKTVKEIEKNGFTVTYLPVTEHGYIEIDAIEKAITSDTFLLIFSAANSETGVKNDIERIADIAEKRGLALIVDAVAIFGKDTFHLPKGVSGAGFSAHKFHGPKGVGFCYVKSPYTIAPLCFGGAQEMGMRPGTEALADILGMVKAIELLGHEKTYHKTMQEMRNNFERSLLDKIPGVEINGCERRVSNVSSLYFSGIDGETLLILLDRNGLYASHGSACSSGSLQPSKTLLAMGYTRERAKGSIRFSLSRYTSQEEIDQAVELISCLAHQLLKLG